MASACYTLVSPPDVLQLRYQRLKTSHCFSSRVRVHKGYNTTVKGYTVDGGTSLSRFFALKYPLFRVSVAFGSASIPTRMRGPKIQPLPEPLRGRDGGFTQTSIYKRLPDILDRLIKETSFGLEIESQLLNIKREILNKESLKLIEDDGGPDVDQWNDLIRPLLGQSWDDIPWYFGEAYMYRRVLQTTGYFRKGTQWFGYDVFTPHKTKSLSEDLPAIREMAERANKFEHSGTSTAQPSSGSPAFSEDTFVGLLEADLWGNRVDLSVRPEGGDKGSALIEAQQQYMIVDDSLKVWNALKGRSRLRIDFIIDNAGFELACDLFLVDYLLSSSLASTVVFHLKGYPLFVSDAMTKDVRYTIDTLSANTESDAVRALANRLTDWTNTGKWRLVEGLFWTKPTPFWEMADEVYEELRKSDLIIVKGDANYRRFGGDRHWPFTTALSDVASYFPAPFVALRTLKSGTLCAGPEAQDRIAQAQSKDPDWLVGGKYGVIQYVAPQHL